MFLDDLSEEGYKSLTRTFLERSKMDDDAADEDRAHLVASMVHAKEAVK